MLTINVLFLFVILNNTVFVPETFIFPQESFCHYLCDLMFSILVKFYAAFPPITNLFWRYYVVPPTVIYNHTDFELTIRHDIIGQHLVHFVVPQLLQKHFDEIPKKPLSMAFFGPPGTGKTLLSKKIADNIFKEGLASASVHVWRGSLFSEDKKKEYKKLQYEIKSHLKSSSICVFIFDNIEDITAGILDALVPFLEKPQTKSRKSIFIFISNSGSEFLQNVVSEAWHQHIPRETLLDSSMFTPYLKKSAYNESGGLQKSNIIEKGLIDVYLPFLPLEKDHVKQCIKLELVKSDIRFKEEDIEIISRLFDYHPPGVEIYSKSGCKKVSRKVELYFDR